MRDGRGLAGEVMPPFVPHPASTAIEVIHQKEVRMFPNYVHSIVRTADPGAWPVAPQGYCECDFAATANALNLLSGAPRYSKDSFVQEAGILFQPRLGGTISPLKVWQIHQHGFGTHFGNLSRTESVA